MSAALQAAIAVQRFGLGARPGEMERAAADPGRWLTGQLAAVPAAPALAGLPDTLSLGRSLREGAMEARRLKEAGTENAGKDMREAMRDIYVDEVGARATTATITTTPLFERLVAFWSNHFAVSATKQQVRGLAGAYEREAIRPHVLGRFVDMLKASARHPAMLLYLDQAQSIGPNSQAGRRRGRGLNENLAREILELHTLGVQGGYAQADVEAFARILTGWTINRPLLEQGGTGAPFLFVPQMHEPGDKTLLGRRFAEAGEAEGLAALEMLAAHPATAMHVATKLCRHFIADTPPPKAVAVVAGRFRDSGGDLAETMRAVIASPEAWAEPLSKLRTPWDWLIAASRAAGLDQAGPWVAKGLHQLGHQVWAPPSPQGWPDRADDWLSPQALMRRIEFARLAATRLGRQRDARALAEATLGPLLSEETRLEIDRAEDGVQALTLFLASPEFQRR